MARAEYIEQTCFSNVEAMPIAAGRAGEGALMLPDGISSGFQFSSLGHAVILKDDC